MFCKSGRCLHFRLESVSAWLIFLHCYRLLSCIEIVDICSSVSADNSYLAAVVVQLPLRLCRYSICRAC